jgi:hypothetical protein
MYVYAASRDQLLLQQCTVGVPAEMKSVIQMTQNQVCSVSDDSDSCKLCFFVTQMQICFVF